MSTTVQPPKPFTDSSQKLTESELPAWSLWGTLVSALAAQACCGLPWLLFTLGFSASSIAYLEWLQPWRPLFVSAGFAFLLAGFFKLWRTRRIGYACKAKPGHRR